MKDVVCSRFSPANVSSREESRVEYVHNTWLRTLYEMEWEVVFVNNSHILLEKFLEKNLQHGEIHSRY